MKMLEKNTPKDFELNPPAASVLSTRKKPGFNVIMVAIFIITMLSVFYPIASFYQCYLMRKMDDPDKARFAWYGILGLIGLIGFAVFLTVPLDQRLYWVPANLLYIGVGLKWVILFNKRKRNFGDKIP